MTIQDQLNELERLDAECERLWQLNQASPEKVPPKREYNTSFFWSFVAFALLACILSHISIPVHIVGG